MPASIPASCSGPNRWARPAATNGTVDNAAPPASTRCRSKATSASPPSSWDCAVPTTSSCPPLTPRCRDLIGPTAASNCAARPAALFGAVASDPTVSRLVNALARNVEVALAGLQGASRGRSDAVVSASAAVR